MNSWKQIFSKRYLYYNFFYSSVHRELVLLAIVYSLNIFVIFIETYINKVIVQ